VATAINPFKTKRVSVMRSVKAHLESFTPYSQSRQHEMPKLDGETNDAHELRTWREKSNYNKDGYVIIPAMALKQCLDAAAKKSGLQIPGKGKSTYAKYFLADVICDEDVVLPVKRDQVESVRISANVDGVRGSGKRVWKTFPVIAAWKAIATFTILDDTVTREIFEKVIKLGGASIGVGRFRPEKGGLNGRFKSTKFEWA
jgi:hypothetical protein